MPFERKHSDLSLSPTERAQLTDMSKSHSVLHGQANRARMLLSYADGTAIYAISRVVGVSRPTVERCADIALSGGVVLALADLPRRGRPATITAEDKAWVVTLACKNAQRPLRTIRLGDVHPPDRCRSIGLLLEGYRQYLQPLLLPRRLDPLERLVIYPRGTAIGAAAAIGIGQHVRTVDLVVQSIEPVGRGFLRFGMQRPLQLPN